jgi:hypothetical protein
MNLCLSRLGTLLLTALEHSVQKIKNTSTFYYYLVYFLPLFNSDSFSTPDPTTQRQWCEDSSLSDIAYEFEPLSVAVFPYGCTTSQREVAKLHRLASPCLSACNNSRTTQRIFIKLTVGGEGVTENCRHIPNSVKIKNNNRACHMKTLRAFLCASLT